jgi:hypothetical protein
MDIHNVTSRVKKRGHACVKMSEGLEFRVNDARASRQSRATLMQRFNNRVTWVLLVALATTTLPRCTIRSIDCTLGTPHADCAKDTLGHEASQDLRRADQTTATIDDQRCRSYGFAPGTANYSQCLDDIARQRSSPAR